jgi:hypothetical protein
MIKSSLATSCATMRAGVRRRSDREFLGLPWYAVALGGDPVRGETRGHARGVVAVGDIATGVVAIGGIARGLIAVGGVAVGLVSFGGLAVGLVGALGGAALALGVAVGGGAAGTLAMGGAAAGHYAVGPVAAGTYVASPGHVDPEILDLANRYGFTLPRSRPAPARAR